MTLASRSSFTFAEILRVMNTIRRGSFLASELNPDSILVFSIFFSRSYRQTAVLLRPPEMDSDQEEGQQREDDHMEYIKTEQRVFADNVATQCHEANLVADQR